MGIQIPVLAIFVVPLAPSEQWKNRPPKDDQERIDKARENEILSEFIHRWQANLKRAVPAAHIVELPGAHHYLFQNEQADVLREIRA